MRRRSLYSEDIKNRGKKEEEEEERRRRRR